MAAPPAAAPRPADIEFTTLGMFIIDQIHYGPSRARRVADDVIGGAGTYGVLGARLFTPPPLSRRIGWIVDAGHDFPARCRLALDALQTRLVVRPTASRATTRGWNSYPCDDDGDNRNRDDDGDHRNRDRDERAFRYLTPKKRLEVRDLRENGLDAASSVHLICSPARARELCEQLAECARGVQVAEATPRIVLWEPVPDLCTPAHRDAMFATAKLVDVITPNHSELAGFFSSSSPSPSPSRSSSSSSAPSAPSTREHIEALARRLVDSGIGPDGTGAVVVRAGKRGCLVASRQLERSVWLPAFHGAGADSGDGDSGDVDGGKNHEKVVDPTGGGNAFVGGMAVGLVRTRDVVRAAAMGIVAASWAIEQIGLPVLTRGGGGGGDATDATEETWNGVAVETRMAEYVRVLGVPWEVVRDPQVGLMFALRDGREK